MVEPGKFIVVNLGRLGARGGTPRGVVQRFEAWEDGRRVLCGRVSGALGNDDRAIGDDPDEAHNHLGAFEVDPNRRIADYVSKLYGTPMPHALFFHGGHAIHACLLQDRWRLGQPASYGCVRVAPTKAKQLFEWAGSDRVRVRVIRE